MNSTAARSNRKICAAPNSRKTPTMVKTAAQPSDLARSPNQVHPSIIQPPTDNPTQERINLVENQGSTTLRRSLIYHRL